MKDLISIVKRLYFILKEIGAIEGFQTVCHGQFCTLGKVTLGVNWKIDWTRGSYKQGDQLGVYDNSPSER